MPSEQVALTQLDAPGPVRAWLAAFTGATRAEGATELDGLFAEVFLNGEPAGAAAVPRAAFLQALPAREEMFRAAGWADPELEVARYEVLGEHFGALVTTWRLSSLDGGSRSVQLRSSFVLRLQGDSAEVIAYLNDQDVRALLGAGMEAG